MVSGSRADYGLLRRLLAEIRDDSALELKLAVTGQHLCKAYGATRSEIESDGFLIDDTVETLMADSGPVGVAKAVGLGVIGFSEALQRLSPDIVVVLGDRFEIFAAVQSALFARLPVAHIHGGETTEGALDESMRHAITKMSHVHFPAAEAYRQRIIRLGEPPRLVFCHGAPGLDDVRDAIFLGRVKLAERLGFRLGRPCFLVTYHPQTASGSPYNRGARALFEALAEFPAATILITGHNSDVGSCEVEVEIQRFISTNKEKVKLFTSMGRALYLSAMRYADVVIGNSSSGIIEAPFLKRPSVNIGDRQKGRLKAASIIDCSEDSASIAAAIRKALSPKFQRSLSAVKSLYGAGGASRKIKETLKKIDLTGIVQKGFFDS